MLGCQIGDFRKPGRVGNGHLRQDFAIQFNAGAFQAVHEFAVRQIVQARGGVNPGDPKFPEITLSGFPVPVSIHQGLVHRVRSGSE